MSPSLSFMCTNILLNSTYWRSLTFLFLYLLSLREELPEAAYMHQLLGLNLLFLLSQNRVSEFHTELERLSARDIQTNVYIRHPVSLEQVLQFNPRQKIYLGLILYWCSIVTQYHGQHFDLLVQFLICSLKVDITNWLTRFIKCTIQINVVLFSLYTCKNNTMSIVTCM